MSAAGEILTASSRAIAAWSRPQVPPTSRTLPSLLARIATAQRAVSEACAADVLSVACREARALLDADSIVVSTRDGNEVTARAVEGPAVPEPGFRIPVEGTLTAVAMATRRSQLCTDAAIDPRTNAALNSRHSIRSSVIVPMLRDGEVGGTICAFSPLPAAFDESDVAVLELLATTTSTRLAAGLAALEHAEVRETLAETQRRLLSAQELTGLAWWEYDIASDTHLWSDEMYRLVGREPGTPAPTLAGYLACIHPDDLEDARQHSQGVTTGRTAHTRVFRVVHPDGSIRTLQSWSDVRADVDGQPRSIFGTTLDVTEREEAAIALRESERRLADAQELTGLAWWEWDVSSGQLRWSDGMHRLIGLDPAERVPTIDEWLRIVHPDDRTPAAALEQRAIREGKGYRLLFRVVLGAGCIRYLQSWVTPVPGPDGQVRMLRGAALDVTAQEEAARAVAASERHFRVAFDNAPIGMMLVSLEPGRIGALMRGNAIYCAMLGYSEEELVGRSVADWTHPGDRAADAERLARLARGEVDSLSYEKRYITSDGRTVYGWVSIALAADTDAPYLICHAMDVTDQRQAQRELERLALSDTLTGLANRTHLDERMSQVLSRMGGRRTGGSVALLLLDLDRFKLVNDSLGHQTGDALLVEVARRLRSVTRQGTTVARLGGDEFVVLLDDIDGPFDALDVARRILATLREPYRLPSGETLVTTASVGIALASSAGRTAEDLYREADLALYNAKDHGRDRYAVFDDDLRAAADCRIESEHRLRRALEQDGLRAVLQPVVDLGTGVTVAMEALVRIEDPHLGMLAPDTFIRVAEDTGLIAAVDAWMVENVIAAVAAARTAHLPPIAVNVSVRTLEHPDYADRVAAALRQHGLDGARLLVEITESTLLDRTPTVTESLRRLRELGIRVGIDDFGTGYSALAYLQQLDLDFLKIDRSFVDRLGRSGRDDAVVAAVIDLAHAHDLIVTAEGVETAAQADALRAMGCDRGQGWLFGRPGPCTAT